MSSASDIWKDNEQSPIDPNSPIMTFGTNTRAVYVMLLHFGWRVDILVEEDVIDGHVVQAQAHAAPSP